MAESYAGFMLPVIKKMIKQCIIEEIYPEPTYEDKLVQEIVQYENQRRE
jgi:hypothetical protein